jgi:hypothetical protein
MRIKCDEIAECLHVEDREHVLLQPCAVGEHALLVKAWTEVASLAGIGQQVVMAAMIAADAREPLIKRRLDRSEP